MYYNIKKKNSKERRIFLKKIAVILMRKNSKGLLDKNIKLFCERPLCFYTIDIAIDSKKFDEIWISSDSE